MSQIPCKQSTRIEMTGWFNFQHYFPGNLRNFLFTVCNYTSYQNLQKTSLSNPFAREKAGDKAGTLGCMRRHSACFVPRFFAGERVGQRGFLKALVTGIVTNRKQKIPQITGKIMLKVKPTGHFYSCRLFTGNL